MYPAYRFHSSKRSGSCISLSQPVVTLLVMVMINQFSAHWNIVRLVMTDRNLGASTPRIDRNLPLSLWTCNLSTLALLKIAQESSTRVRNFPNILTRSADVRRKLTKTSSIYGDVARCIDVPWEITAFIIDRIIIGATFRPNPSRVRQHVCPFNIAIWKGHSDLSMCTRW